MDPQNRARARHAHARRVEWEYQRVTLSRDLSRNAVRALLVELAEHGGWELDTVRIGNDGVRRIVVRRKIIRARPTLWAS